MLKTTVLFLLVGVSAQSGTVSDSGGNCGVIGSLTMAEGMIGFWSTLSADEQAAVTRTIAGALRHYQYRSQIPLDETFPVFVGLVEHMLTGKLEAPNVWDSQWIKRFLAELARQPQTVPAIKEQLLAIPVRD